MSELIFAVCEDLFRKLEEVSDEAVAGVPDPHQRMGLRARAYIQFGLDNPEPYRIMFMARPVADGPQMTAEELQETATFGHLQADVTAAMEAGSIPPGDPFTAACGLWAAAHGVTSLLIAKPDLPWPPLEDFIVACVGACAASGTA